MRRLLSPGYLAAAVVLAVALAVAAPAGAQWVTNYLGRTFTSVAPSGANGFTCRTAGCRVDFGPGATDHLYSSDGFSVFTPNAIVVGAAAGTYLNQGGFRLSPGVALGTCSSSYEGVVMRLVGTGGSGTGAQTRLCACVSDGGGSPLYFWRNVISGTLGNATTCSP